MRQYSIQTTGIVGLLAFLFTACSSESPVDNGSQEQELVISAEIIPSGESKALGAPANGIEKLAFTNNDLISITRSDKSRVYKLTDKRWLPEQGGDELAVDGTSQKYTAIYPSGFTGILADQHDNTGDKYTQSNKLISEVTTTSNYIPFKFGHAFAKITIVVAYKTNSQRKNVTVKLVGGNIRTSDGTGDETIKMLRTMPEDNTLSVSHTFICILNPGEARGFTLTVSGTTSDDNQAADEKYTQASRVFKAGNNYIYNFSSNDNLILNGVTVAGFDEGGKNDVGNAT